MPKDKNSPSFSEATVSILPRVAFNLFMPIPMRKDHSIIFLHIPQTGGSNLNYLVGAKTWVPPESKIKPPFKAYRFALATREDKISPKKMSDGWQGGLYTAKKILKDKPDFCEDIDFVQSHFPFGIHEYIETRTTSYVTLIRDPIERELSALNFTHQRGYTIENSPEEYLKECLDNPQTRLLAGYEAMQGDCTEQTLQKAKKNIEEHFLLAGITEDTNAFIQIFASMQKWGPVALCRAQVTGKKLISTPSTELKKMLEDRHQFDVQLYAWAKRRWYDWKQKYVQDEPQAISRQHRILSLLPNYPTVRAPQFLMKHEIQAYNRSVSDELVRVIQNSSGLSSITASQAKAIVDILDNYIPDQPADPSCPRAEGYQKPAAVVFEYLYHRNEVIERIGAVTVAPQQAGP